MLQTLINYYENGNIHYQGEWVDDKCHGKGIGYHENGDLVNPKEVAEKLLPFCTGVMGENGHRYDVRNL